VLRRVRIPRFAPLIATAALAAVSFVLLAHSSGHTFNLVVGYSTIVGSVIALYATFKANRGAETLDDAHLRSAASSLAGRVTRSEGQQRQRLLDRASEPAPAFLRAASSLRSYRAKAQPSQANSGDAFRTFWNLGSRRLLILGEPGAGKTLLLLEIIKQAAEARRKDHNIPVLIRVNIAEWRDDQTFLQYFTAKVASEQLLPAKLVERMLEERLVIPLLDGLDEFDEDEDHPSRGEEAIKRLNVLADGSYPVDAPLIVTCRRAYFEALVELQVKKNKQDKEDRLLGLADAAYMVLEPLNENQIMTYLRNNLTDEARVRWRPVLSLLNPLSQDIAKDRLVATLGSPWRLMLVFRAYAGRGLPIDLLEGQDVDEIEARLLPQFLAVAMQWQGKRKKDRGDGYGLHQAWVKPVASDQDKIIGWLKQIAVYLDLDREHDGGAGELKPFQIYQMVDRRLLRIAFASCILMASAAIGAVITIVAVDGSHPFPRVAAICTAGIFLIGGAQVAAFGAPGSPAATSLLRELRTPAGTLDLGISLFCAIAASVFTLGTDNAISARILGGCCCGFMAGLFFGFVHARRLRSRGVGMETSQGPADPMRGGLLTSSSIGVLVSLIYGAIIYVTGNGLPASIVFAACTVLLFAPVMGMPFVSMAWSRYRLATLILFLQRRLPWRLITFLQWNYDAGLMRISGLSYQFRHLKLQRWLAHTELADLLPADAKTSAGTQDQAHSSRVGAQGTASPKTGG
jgi:hypothetical protein